MFKYHFNFTEGKSTEVAIMQFTDISTISIIDNIHPVF